jgi:hypothetical protein
MAFSVNGVGTSMCFARGSGIRGGDALECFVILFMPIVPLRPVHLFGESSEMMGSNYQAVPIRWSFSLVLRVFLLYWMAFPLLGGLILTLVTTMKLLHGEESDRWTPYAVGGWIVTLVCGLGYLLLWLTDKRNRRIRRVLGRHPWGRSDPAMWTQDLLSRINTPKEMFGEDSWSAAVPARLEQGDYSGAMWAARLAVALEDRGNGERLTDEVLRVSQGRKVEIA